MPSKKPRVCFLLGGLETGGVAASTLQLVSRIDRKEFEVKVALCEDGPYAGRLREIGQRCDILGTGRPPLLRRVVGDAIRRDWSGCRRFPGWLMRTVLAVARYVRVHDVDIIHTNYHHFHLVAGLASRLTGRKCVWHWRGVMRSRVFKRISPLLHPFAVPFSWSIANSHSTLESVRVLAGERVCVVYNGLELGPPPTDRSRLRTLLNLPEGTRIIGLVGTVYSIKGQRHLLDASTTLCRKYDNVHIVFIGGPPPSGSQDYLDSLLARRAALGLESKVHFLGHRADASELTAGFDIATVCTLPPGEGFGLVIIEAMAKAVPVIATNVGGAVEILTHNDTGVLIPAADPDVLAAALDQLLQDDERRQRLALAGYESCRQRFDIERTTGEVETVYRKLLR